jgi:Fe2+ transport system protein FeoA
MIPWLVRGIRKEWYKIMNSPHINLYKADRKSELVVINVPDIALLKSLGIRFGTHVRLLYRYCFGGAVVLRIEDAYTVALGKDVAVQVGVEEVVP